MLDLVIRTTALLVSAWAATALARRSSAATRYLIWHSAIVAVLAAPLLLPVAPTFNVPGLRAATAMAAEFIGFAAATESAQRSAVAGPPSSFPSDSNPSSADRAFSNQGAGAVQPIAFGTLVRLLWLPGSILLALWFLIGWIQLAWSI